MKPPDKEAKTYIYSYTTYYAHNLRELAELLSHVDMQNLIQPKVHVQWLEDSSQYYVYLEWKQERLS
jgi:hypothetical protein